MKKLLNGKYEVYSINAIAIDYLYFYLQSVLIDSIFVQLVIEIKIKLGDCKVCLINV